MKIHLPQEANAGSLRHAAERKLASLFNEFLEVLALGFW